MLKNIDPLLNADVLHALRSMGHGDELIISDAHFPSDSIARHTAIGKLLRIDASADRVAQAVLSVMALDSFVPDPALRMEVVDNPAHIPEVQQDVQALLEDPLRLAPIERHAFYERARRAYCVIATADTRSYGCFIFKKGVLNPTQTNRQPA